MNTYLRRGREKLQSVIRAARGFWLMFKRLLREQFNKNIYTRILFTNVTAFVVGLIALSMLSSFVVKQVTSDQVQQELLRKAKRVNFALLQQKDQAWGTPLAEQTSDRAEGRQDLLKFLADIFDARITVFDREGNIMGTSEEQEVVPGSKVEAKFVEILTRGETAITRTVDRETGRLTFIAVVPMGNNKDAIENGILLETKPSNLDLALNKMRLYLVIGGMVILVIIIFVSVYLAMYISRPISRLATTVAEISRGSYVLSGEDQPLDEINVLAGQLNKLAVRLQKIQAESRRMEEERARLFAEISHELRTPLTAVQGFIEAIRDGMVQDEALLERYLDTIYTQTVHITRLVDDILELSRLESGNITVEKLPVDLIALAQGVAMSMEGVARSKNTSILFEAQTEDAVVIGDVDRMEQIIRNLLKNAVTATENGTIRVGVGARQGEVVLTIEDNGIGIPPEDLPHIWDRFYRVKNQRGGRMQEKGSGLGLVIVKKLVQLQGGKIDVVSQLGKGTTFSISFPSYNQK
ncbi:Signal transduction histidine kinase, core [Moorella glycerini]|uniref:histidine kinase n=1 Tax=Neomoorella stamsii TaxID=1266720 RepID=A0A9X7J2R9_9FIRM|nr:MULTISPECIES: HAMP domain-containing sensor histidine kinase [Moorella]PRR72408.1 Alkaline phosphatase synthesis sensor protein PhoR [Moorella stamsii]CEP67417.1 Signal transduction histidine kinase, core [Moorella glycerini]